MLLYEYTDESGKYVDIKQLSIKSQGKDKDKFERALHYREMLIEKLIDYNEELGEVYLES